MHECSMASIAAKSMFQWGANRDNINASRHYFIQASIPRLTRGRVDSQHILRYQKIMAAYENPMASLAVVNVLG
jgi:hypothetical protein